MSNIFTQSLPLIKTNEKAEMMNSVQQMLRREGFVVILLDEELIRTHKKAYQLDQRDQMQLDCLAILRYVRNHWNQEAPVLIQAISGIVSATVSQMAA